MYLQACESLATREPTLAALIQRLDEALANMGSAGECSSADLAYLLREDVQKVESILDELIDLGGLTKEERVCCPNRCFNMTREEHQDAMDEDATPRCPECDARITMAVGNISTVYVIHKIPNEARRSSNRLSDGRALAHGGPHKMLFAAANPDVQPLAVDTEWRYIEQRFSQKQCRVLVERIDRWAATTEDLRRAILDHRPVLVHFSGHGTLAHGLRFADASGRVHRVKGRALARLFLQFRFLECVLLNACYSAKEAAVIAEHVHCVIGVRGEIGDDSAIAFSTGFYDALAAGEPYGCCFDFGVNAIDLANLTDVDRPTIWLDGIEYPVSLD